MTNKELRHERFYSTEIQTHVNKTYVIQDGSIYARTMRRGLVSNYEQTKTVLSMCCGVMICLGLAIMTASCTSTSKGNIIVSPKLSSIDAAPDDADSLVGRRDRQILALCREKVGW